MPSLCAWAASRDSRACFVMDVWGSHRVVMVFVRSVVTNFPRKDLYPRPPWDALIIQLQSAEPRLMCAAF